ncbi:hypothetical protein BS47DRAFT_1362400 [Hydnum rufescens UP504]|uniref:Uncharacterized protein n=1 Tax=Hydnum rufescens UP504 TaxID=1448309 RepID=A0A9P6AX00_9AGAM|nr:hypothetical protein BS47DRAFT_1362400 [Hydnum rufescens UP504]
MYWICVYWVSILVYLCLIEASELIELGFCDGKTLQKAPEGFRRHEAYALKAQNKDHAYFGSQALKPSEVSEPILGFPDAVHINGTWGNMEIHYQRHWYIFWYIIWHPTLYPQKIPFSNGVLKQC